MKEKKVQDVFCPLCGQSLIRKNNVRLIINGYLTDRVLLFMIVRGDGEKGELELSLTPGDYRKFCTINLHPEEELTFIHSSAENNNDPSDRGCRKSMNQGMFVKILVQFEDSPDIYEHYIVAKNGVEATLYNVLPSHIDKKKKFECIIPGSYPNIKDYLKEQLQKITNR